MLFAEQWREVPRSAGASITTVAMRKTLCQNASSRCRRSMDLCRHGAIKEIEELIRLQGGNTMTQRPEGRGQLRRH